MAISYNVPRIPEVPRHTVRLTLAYPALEFNQHLQQVARYLGRARQCPSRYAQLCDVFLIQRNTI